MVEVHECYRSYFPQRYEGSSFDLADVDLVSVAVAATCDHNSLNPTFLKIIAGSTALMIDHHPMMRGRKEVRIASLTPLVKMSAC